MTERFDQFGLEGPFAEAADERPEPYVGEGPASEPFGEGEELAWIEGEAPWASGESLADDFAQDFAEDLAGEFVLESTGSSPATKPLEGGVVWTSRMPAPLDAVTCFLPPAALKAKELDLVVYIHGLLHRCPNGSTDMERLVASDLFKLARHVAQSGKPVLLVVPRMQTRLADGSWTARGLFEPERLSGLADAALAQGAAALGVAPRQARSLTLAGHSMAYWVIYPLIRKLAADASARRRLTSLRSIWMLDASYQHPKNPYPRSAIRALGEYMPALSIVAAYLRNLPTDRFEGRSGGSAPQLIPFPAKVSHCGLPAAVLPQLLADHLPGTAERSAPVRELFSDEADLESEWRFESASTDSEFADEALFEQTFDNFEDSEWGQAEAIGESPEGEGETERRCGQDEVLLEGIDPFLEAEEESDVDGRIALRERVLAAHIAATEKRLGRRAQADLRDDQLGMISGTSIKTRKDTALAAEALLATANAALAAARAAGDLEALKVRSISVTSGYRSAARQLALWRRVFSAPGGYFDKTAAARRDLPGGPLGDAAVAYFLKSPGKGGFGIGGRIAAPGFSNHQSGIALDFLVNLQNGGTIKHDSQDRFRAIWRKSWFHTWMKANAAGFGFQPIPTEEWHWEYRPAGGSQPESFEWFDAEAEGADSFKPEQEELLDDSEWEDIESEESAPIHDGEIPIWRDGNAYFPAAAAGRAIAGIRRDDGQVLLAVNVAGNQAIALADAAVGTLHLGAARPVSRCRRAILTPQPGSDAFTARLTGGIVYVLADGTELLRKSGSVIRAVPNVDLPADLIARFFHGTRLDLAGEPQRLRMTYRWRDEVSETARWVSAKAKDSDIAARRSRLATAAAAVPASLRPQVVGQLDLLAVVSVVEGDFGRKSIPGDTHASLGIFQWAMKRNQWQETGSLGRFFRDLKARAQAANPPQFFVDAWAACTAKGLDTVQQGDRTILTLNGANATGGQVESAMSGAMGAGSLAAYQLVASLDWIDDFRNTIVSPGPAGRMWLGLGWSISGSRSARFEVGRRSLGLSAGAAVTRLSTVFASSASLATAVMLGVNRPSYVPLALWRALAPSQDPSAHVGALLDRIFKGCEAAGQRPARGRFEARHATAAGGDALAAFSDLRDYLWPVHAGPPLGNEPDLRTAFERKAMLLYDPAKDKKFERAGRFATVRALLP